MVRLHRTASLAPLLVTALMLTACGGGSDSATSTPVAATPAPATAPQTLAQEPGAPQFTGNTARDGFNWFNYRRQQMGVPMVTSNSVIDKASLGHSEYQRLNNTITHDQIVGKPGFTGVSLLDRLKAANYPFVNTASYAYGEVISATGDTSGFQAAEELITAIYHRYAVFEPSFKEAGVGAATVTSGYTYFTTDFAANNGFGPGLGKGKFAVYPFENQQRVPVIFYSNTELPDPVPDRNEVGYPISVHADITANLAVQTFTVQQRGGAVLNVQLMTNARDPETPTSAAAIIPVNVLLAATTYDVKFVGTVDGVAVNRSWSFTTR